MAIYGKWVYVTCTLVFAGSMYADTGIGSPTSRSCPLECDLIHEVQILRQLLSQEGLLRINTNVRLQELEKSLESVHQNTQRNNASIEKMTTAMEELEQATNVQVAVVKGSVRRAEAAISAVQNINRGTRQTLTKLEQDVVSLNHTYQGKYKSYEIFYETNLTGCVKDTCLLR